MIGTYSSIARKLGNGPFELIGVFTEESYTLEGIPRGENFDGKCEHCGQPLIYFVTVCNDEGTFTLGHDCAARALSGPGVDLLIAKIRKEVAKLAMARRYRRANARREIANAITFAELEQKDNVLFAALNCADNETLRNMKAQWISYGPISEKAQEYAKKVYLDVLFPPPPNTPVQTGRRVVSGKVLSAKVQSSDYGPVRKGLILTDENEKVWGNFPSAWLHIDTLIGSRVSFTATVTIGDDPLFGFWKRPSKPKILN